MASVHGTLDKAAIVVGRDYTALVVLDPDVDEGDSDVETALTGATITAEIRDTDPDTTLIATATAALEGAASARTIRVTLTDTITGALEPGRYRWDVRVTTSGGLIYPVTGLGPAWVRALP